jgi:integrase
MTVRKKMRRGKPRLVIEIPYKDPDTGVRIVFRQDATVQNKTAAEAEHRRKLIELAETGRIRRAREKRLEEKEKDDQKRRCIAFRDAYDLFKETKAASRIKATTRRGYFVSLDTYMVPRWADLPVDGTLWFNEFDKLDAEMKQAGLKPTTRANVMCAGRSVLRHCVDAGLLAEMPRLPRLPKAGEVVLSVPSSETVEKVLAHAKPHLRRAILLATDAGLRAGEVRGLTWEDVDLAEKMLVVRRAIYHGEFDTPKSGHQRGIFITRRLADELAMVAPKAPTSAAVAPNSHGRVWREPSLNHGLKALLRRLGLPSFRFHDLRHYYVTRMFKVGVGAPTVRDLAGHKHMHVTARYAHTDEKAKRAAVAALDALDGAAE